MKGFMLAIRRKNGRYTDLRFTSILVAVGYVQCLWAEKLIVKAEYLRLQDAINEAQARLIVEEL